MCEVDVLDLSVRCQSQQLPQALDSVNSWTTSTTPLAQIETSPPWSNSTASRGGQYELEPVSPSSSPGTEPSSYLAGRELSVFYPRRPADHISQQSPATAGQWSSDAPIVTTSAAQPASSVSPRRWNGDDGHPFSPLKRVLHQYRNSVASEEYSAPASNIASAGTTNGAEVVVPPSPTSSATTSTSSVCRKPTATTAGMSFEDFVLGMLSKVGGGKAITAATQSYLRDSASTTSNRGSGTPAEARTTGIDDVQRQNVSSQRPRYDDRSVYQTLDQRQQLERQMLAPTIQRDEYNPSYQPRSIGVTPGHPGLQYPSSHLAPDLRMIAPQSQPSILPAGSMRRPLTRADDRDDAYRERRRKNNEAAKRSRDTRRLKELQVAAQAERLAEENLQLKAEIAVLRSQLGYLHRMMLDNNNGANVNGSDEARSDDHRNSSTHHQYPPEDGGRTV